MKSVNWLFSLQTSKSLAFSVANTNHKAYLNSKRQMLPFFFYLDLFSTTSHTNAIFKIWRDLRLDIFHIEKQHFSISLTSMFPFLTQDKKIRSKINKKHLGRRRKALSSSTESMWSCLTSQACKDVRGKSVILC